ncbi:OsmC family protein [Leisingera sp. ANG-Vp]|uniref:OsmC family protein n=1 Tax=Leisingera sp. ANG-Vp TaxID=1577896 RepID=UPI00057CB4BA|nr:OsmC family protein [Leisingera sp. ANG-Vp]KIC20362.1 osmotically inducible protein OsmC [Leisingera sp. ANG-Vp]
MSELSVDVSWFRNTPHLIEGQVDKAHEILYNSQFTLPGDAAPDWGGDPDSTNPEQALAASLSSCHMMTFLALAAKAGWPVATYADHAEAALGKTEKGMMAVTELKLSPRVTFDTGFDVTPAKVEEMHERAHRYCFVANSISAKMTITPVV